MVGSPVLERESEAVDGVAAHQMGQLDHVAQGVTAGVPRVRDARGHVGRVDLGSVNSIRQPDPPAPWLDVDFSQVALLASHHLEHPAVR